MILRHKRHQLDIFNAIKYAQQAYRQFNDETDLQKKVYALNQYIFYSVEGEDDKIFDEIKQTTRILANFKANPLVWQFRYDDTLARYFHRLSIMAENPQEKRKYIDWAMERINDALQRSDGDRDIEHYHAVLTTYEASMD